MKVRIIKKGGYGEVDGTFHKENSVAELPDALALKLITYRIAVPVDTKPERKTAVTTAAFAPAENAMQPKPRGRPRKVFLPEESE